MPLKHSNSRVMGEKVLYEQVLKIVRLTGPWRVLGRPGSVEGWADCRPTAGQDAVLSDDFKSPEGPYICGVTASHRWGITKEEPQESTPALVCRCLKQSPWPPQLWMVAPEGVRARPLSVLRASCSFISEPAQSAVLSRAQRALLHTPEGPNTWKYACLKAKP